jgi:hypothetical protein
MMKREIKNHIEISHMNPFLYTEVFRILASSCPVIIYGEWMIVNNMTADETLFTLKNITTSIAGITGWKISRSVGIK